MAFSSLSCIQSFLYKSSGLAYIFNLDPSLVIYYPLDTYSNSKRTPNYGSIVNGVSTYDASFVGTGTLITTSPNTFITGLGDLSLNNTMGGTASNYVISDNSFNLIPSSGLTISCWFSTAGVAGKIGTLISLSDGTTPPMNSNNLVAYYPLSSINNSNTTANYYLREPIYDFNITDGASINNSCGTQPPFSNSRNALNVTGIASYHYVYVNNSSVNFGLSFWCYLSSELSPLAIIMSWTHTYSPSADPDGGTDYFLYYSGRQFITTLFASGGPTNLNVLPLNTWFFCAYSYVGSTINILVKPYGGGADIYKGTLTVTNTRTLPPRYFFFGQQGSYNPSATTATETSNGYYSNFQVYNTTLSISQMEELYNNNYISNFWLKRGIEIDISGTNMIYSAY